MNHLIWAEKYRPETIDKCILPERLKKPFQEYVNSGNIPHLLLHGGAGVGKTTVAKAMDLMSLASMFFVLRSKTLHHQFRLLVVAKSSSSMKQTI
jgi:replication-associated recombination protein RarA